MTSDTHSMRQHILDVAKPIILGKGFSAVGLNEILTAANVPKGSFYHYFKSKDAFGAALLDSYFDDYFGRLELMLAPNTHSAAERMVAYWTRWLETQAGDCCEEKCLTVKLAGEVSDLSEAMRESLRRGTNQLIARLAQCISEGIADGSLEATLDAEHAAETLYQMWLGATLLAKVRRDNSSLSCAMQSTLAILQLNTQ
ncbi:TetR/AcrR family transcriptional regulator [Chitinibacter bivalviorum]|uniref:TetR/AcrR family transcriptional regulator n=1 Tax=Chitinibacter bivalviorum TaxID=2739434 RepID=A0A7H9BL25_9NEIS|nr:TetR/AcrR family transcriptional regulator [Chitinibacter bivalviorum]QLG89380.1 TetR/AcrR family transcriptional regulator [Chitinibacter bivalviorum]